MSEYEREADKLRERKLKEDIKVRRQRIEKREKAEKGDGLLLIQFKNLYCP